MSLGVLNTSEMTVFILTVFCNVFATQERYFLLPKQQYMAEKWNSFLNFMQIDLTLIKVYEGFFMLCLYFNDVLLGHNELQKLE